MLARLAASLRGRQGVAGGNVEGLEVGADERPTIALDDNCVVSLVMLVGLGFLIKSNIRLVNVIRQNGFPSKMYIRSSHFWN